MNDSAIFQGLARAFSAGTPPVALPVVMWKNLFFDCPLAASAHLQQFVGRQLQEQVTLMGEIAREQNPQAAVTREVAFLQQSALAWSNEWLEVAELVQSRLLNAVQNAPLETPTPYSRAA